MYMLRNGVPSIMVARVPARVDIRSSIIIAIVILVIMLCGLMIKVGTIPDSLYGIFSSGNNAEKTPFWLCRLFPVQKIFPFRRTRISPDGTVQQYTAPLK